MTQFLQMLRGVQAYFVLYVYLFVGVVLTLSAFYIEHILGALPCEMCWWQRYTHWAIWGVALFGILLQRYVHPRVFVYVLVMIVSVSAFIGFYQGFGQMGWVELPASCTGSLDAIASPANLLEALTNDTSASPSCAEVSFTIFGISLAWWNALIMTLAFVDLVFYLLFTRRTSR